MERKEALEVVRKNMPTDRSLPVYEALQTLIPELRESEDERTRNNIIASVEMNGGLTQAQKSKIYAYLEKQKEQKPTEPSDEELQRHQDELYDFKVFAARQAREHHISFVHDFEWNNFCAEILSYFNQQKPEERFKEAREKYQVGWSEEDKKMLAAISKALGCDTAEKTLVNEGVTLVMAAGFLESLRPSWKPSKGQMDALLWCVAHLGGADHRVLAELYEHLKSLM